MRGDPARTRGRALLPAISAWTALAAGVVCAVCVGVLVVGSIEGLEDETEGRLLWSIGVTAGVAFVAAIPALRRRRLRPIAMEGVELAFVGTAVLAAIAFFVYVVFDDYVG